MYKILRTTVREYFERIIIFTRIMIAQLSGISMGITAIMPLLAVNLPIELFNVAGIGTKCRSVTDKGGYDAGELACFDPLIDYASSDFRRDNIVWVPSDGTNSFEALPASIAQKYAAHGMITDAKGFGGNATLIFDKTTDKRKFLISAGHLFCDQFGNPTHRDINGEPIAADFHFRTAFCGAPPRIYTAKRVILGSKECSRTQSDGMFIHPELDYSLIELADEVCPETKSIVPKQLYVLDSQQIQALKHNSRALTMVSIYASDKVIEAQRADQPRNTQIRGSGESPQSKIKNAASYYIATGTAIDVNKTTLRTNLKTLPFSSGSAIYYRDSDYIIAIHRGSYENSDRNNAEVLISDKIKSDLSELISNDQ